MIQGHLNTVKVNGKTTEYAPVRISSSRVVMIFYAKFMAFEFVVTQKMRLNTLKWSSFTIPPPDHWTVTTITVTISSVILVWKSKVSQSRN